MGPIDPVALKEPPFDIALFRFQPEPFQMSRIFRKRWYYLYFMWLEYQSANGMGTSDEFATANQQQDRH
jgi:hypothetical protein